MNPAHFIYIALVLSLIVGLLIFIAMTLSGIHSLLKPKDQK